MANITKDVRDLVSVLVEINTAVNRSDLKLEVPTKLEEILQLRKVPLAPAIRVKYKALVGLHNQAFVSRLNEANLNAYRCTLKSLQPNWLFKSNNSLLLGTATITIISPEKVVYTFKVTN